MYMYAHVVLNVHVYDHARTPLATPPRKKPRLNPSKKSKAEKTLEKAMASFMKYQHDADQEYKKYEEER